MSHHCLKRNDHLPLFPFHVYIGFLGVKLLAEGEALSLNANPKYKALSIVLTIYKMEKMFTDVFWLKTYLRGSPLAQLVTARCP